jgi:hypothetical protein
MSLPREIESAQPPPQAVQAALDRLCASAPFKSSPQLAAFLRYVVETALNGRADTIKAYTIAVDALGRPDNFDPIGDAIVRVEARRLRRGLAQYYEHDGGQDPVVIGMAPGSYVPSITVRGEPGNVVPFEKRKGHVIRRETHLVYSAAVIVEGRSVLSEQHRLFMRCHSDLAVMFHKARLLRLEIETARNLITQTRTLVARSRRRRFEIVD